MNEVTKNARCRGGQRTTKTVSQVQTLTAPGLLSRATQTGIWRSFAPVKEAYASLDCLMLQVRACLLTCKSSRCSAACGGVSPC